MTVFLRILFTKNYAQISDSLNLPCSLLAFTGWRADKRIWQLVCFSDSTFYFSRLTLRLKVMERSSFPTLDILVDAAVRVVFVGVGEGLDEGDSCSILLPAVPGVEPEPLSRSFRWRLNRPMPGRYISMLGRSYKYYITIFTIWFQRLQ